MISLVVPVYNEEESLQELHAEIADVAKTFGWDIEILFIDDGSSDESWQVVERLAAGDPRVRGLRFRRNFGKAAALAAGFEEAQGEFVFTLDADLQDDPHEMPRFLEAMAEGKDVISGWKQVRHDPWHKVGPSRVFNWLVGRMTGVRLHDHNCGFKCYRREIFDEVHLYGEMHRFVPVLAASHGWRVGEIVVNHRARKFGHSKYGVKRIVKGFLDLLTVYFLTSYGTRPQHLLGSAGLLGFSAGLLGVLILTVWWFVSRLVHGFEPINLHERAIFYYSMAALLLGAQLVSVGILAELITAYHMRDTRAYSIRERTPGQTASTTDTDDY
jgi:glycosyltransferase involved in cell wall biosynthesis